MSERPTECVGCTKRVVCRLCGEQLCFLSKGRCEVKGHYVWEDASECVECHQLETLKGKIG